MAINKLVDPGEVYVIGQYAIGTSNPTSLYKIGIVQNDRSTESRVDEHQTGNPNRLFIAAKIPSEASYMVEQQMHKTWNSVRVGQEWFNLSNAADLAKVTAEVHALEAQYGPQILQLRSIYYTTPTPGENTTLTPAERTKAEHIRDEAFELTEQMALLKYRIDTYGFQLQIPNGLRPSMDSITSCSIRPSKTEFKDSKLPAALKAAFMTKPRKNKDDFRFNFVGITASIDDLKLDAAHWKNKYPTEYQTWAAEKEAWKVMKATITPLTVNHSILNRTPAAEALHQHYTDARNEFNRLSAMREVLQMECQLLCGDYEKIDAVCTWKRATQTNAFNLPEFKVHHPAEFADPAHQSTSAEGVAFKVNPYKTYR